ncbi:MAG: PIG-L family deacetylase [Phycisphaerales bacterium]
MARVAVFGPHPDDQELGMGGTIARLALQGHHVLLVDMTDGEPTPFGDHDTRKGEAFAALDVLREGVTTGSVERLCLGLPNRTVQHTIEARHAVAGVIRAWQAEIIFSPALPDAHPDHVATAHIVRDARFDAKLTKIDMPAPVCAWDGREFAVGDPIYPRWHFGYFCTHLRSTPSPDFCFDVTGLVERKIASIRAYETQFVMPEKNRRVLEWVEHAASYFGSRIGTAAAEPFASPEPLGFDSLAGLVGV